MKQGFQNAEFPDAHLYECVYAQVETSYFVVLRCLGHPGHSKNVFSFFVDLLNLFWRWWFMH